MVDTTEETVELDPQIKAVLDKVDEFLADISHQTIVEAGRVQDFVLDVRLLLTCPSEN